MAWTNFIYFKRNTYKKKKKYNYDDYEELSDDYSLFEIKNNEQTIKNTNNNDNIN